MAKDAMYVNTATENYIGHIIHGYEILDIVNHFYYLVKNVETGSEFTVTPLQLRNNKIIDSFARVDTAYPHLKSLWS